MIQIDKYNMLIAWMKIKLWDFIWLKIISLLSLSLCYLGHTAVKRGIINHVDGLVIIFWLY